MIKKWWIFLELPKFWVLSCHLQADGSITSGFFKQGPEYRAKDKKN